MCKVSIVLSIYKPDKSFLKEQLESLNNQTYKNIDLIVWNDCPEDNSCEEIIKNTITAFPYTYYNEHINLGYTKAFEKLITLADGEYVSFCDQDDIWEKDKVLLSLSELEKHNGNIVACDKSLMNSDGEIYTKSVRENSKKKSETWNTGDDITSKAVFVCYATGMSILAKREDLLKVMPFPKRVAHDRWIMACLSAMGKAVYVNKPLIRYRRTGKNETGILKNVNSKKDYYASRSDNTEFISAFKSFFPHYKDLDNIIKCNNARMSGNIFKIFKYRQYIPDLYLYEIALSLCPDFVFKKLKNIIF